MFSIMCVCLFTGGEGFTCSDHTVPVHLVIPLPIYRFHHTSPYRDLQTCLTWTSQYKDPPVPDMLKLVQYYKEVGSWHSTEMPSCYFIFTKEVALCKISVYFVKRVILFQNVSLSVKQDFRFSEKSKNFGVIWFKAHISGVIFSHPRRYNNTYSTELIFVFIDTLL